MMLMNSKKFGLVIEALVKSKKISYIDAILHFCEKNDVDPSSVGSMVNKSLKEKIQIEAENLRLLKTDSTGKLPI